MNNKALLILIVAFLAIPHWSCTDLEENILDESLSGAGRAEVISGAIAPAYGQVSRTWLHTSYYGLQLIASDEAILPYRGGTDWFDGGKFIAVHQHNMTSGNDLVRSSWNEVAKNISRTVSAIEVLRPLAEEGNTQAASALYEMIALRAYLNMLMLESWGLIFQKESSADLSIILRGQEALDYLESELLYVADVISKDLAPARMSQPAVWGLLARLYLNAAVYRDPYGTPDFRAEDMNKVVQYTTNIINSGQFNISPEYFELFNDNNNTNPEVIFSLDQRGVVREEHSRWAYWSIAGSMFGRPEFSSADGTDGPAFTSDYYQTWVEAYGNSDPAAADARFFQENIMIPDALKDLTGVSPANDADHYYCIRDVDFEMNRGILRGVLWGPRKGTDGAFLKCDDGRVRIYPVIQTKGNGPDRNVGYVSHTEDVDFSNEGRLHNKGYRCAKYQFSRTSPNANNFYSVELVLMHLGEIYLMRAEAKLRLGDTAGALADVNALRAGRTARPEVTPPALATMNLEILFRERGFELYWEGFRRGDQIRFGKFEDSWTEKTDSDKFKRLFPIPQSAIDGASNVKGYLVQNQGY